MSIGAIYLCCDDGSIFATEVVRHGVWMIWLNEYGEDEFCLPAKIKQKPMDIVKRDGLPIDSLTFQRHGHTCIGRCAIHTIVWTPNNGFPRRLLRADMTARQPENCREGTYKCYWEGVKRGD